MDMQKISLLLFAFSLFLRLRGSEELCLKTNCRLHIDNVLAVKDIFSHLGMSHDGAFAILKTQA